MKIYQHYSFDLWMTLIKSNPAFKQERTKFFHNNFNTRGTALEEVGLVFRQIDVMCNAINEKTGGNMAAEEMYLMVISTINDYHYPLQEVNLTALYADMEELVLKYLPVTYSNETAKVLHELKQKAPASTFSLLSNTAFIKGSTLRKVLKRLELDQYFDFQLYSDEIGMSKPNATLFKLMIEAILEKRGLDNMDLKEILHIGDNPKADIWGAEKAGVSSLLINSNNLTISTLL
ncbi:MAG TPA: HAD family hydrolase [Segetibacter sp.]|jgi:putative hydrolase of the HAD superfamily